MIYYTVRDEQDNIQLITSNDEELKDFVENLKNGTFHTKVTFSCKGRGCNSSDTEERADFHGIYTGAYCDPCYENNYPYKKDDYTDGTGVAIDGTPININY